MANQDDPKGNKPMGGPMRPPPLNMVKVGVSHKGATAASLTPETTVLGGGPPMNVLLPAVDHKSLQVMGYEPTLKHIELKDKKNQLVRLRQTGRAGFVMEHVIGRDRPVPVSLTLPAGQELVPLLWESAQRAIKEPRLAPHAEAITGMVRALADASQTRVDQAAFAAASAAAQKEMGTVAYGARPGSSWSGFAQKGPVLNAPPERPPPVDAGNLEDGILRVAPGLHLASLTIGNVNPQKGFFLLTDILEREVAVMQTKFSIPPMFSLEFRAPDQDPVRHQVPGPLARQLAAIIRYIMENDPPSEQQEKQLNIIRSALLRVL